ncbi:hypothetical protein ACSNN9_26365 [Micromonospora sp. URMC 107]
MVAYRNFASPDDEDSGVRACRSTGVLIRGEADGHRAACGKHGVTVEE